jgi:hypothetical protein
MNNQPQDSRIIIQIQTIPKDIIRFYDLFMNSYNQFRSTKNITQLFIEITEDAAIFFFENMDGVHFVLEPLKDREVLNFDPITQLEDEYLQKLFHFKHLFPDNGFQLAISIISGNEPEILKLAKEFMISIHPDVHFSSEEETVEDITRNILVVDIWKYELLENYLKFMVISYSALRDMD